MVRIVLIRPGATDYDLQERIQGNLDIPLSHAGEAAVSQWAESLREQAIQVVYAPESEPATQTAELLAAALGIRHRRVDRLANLDLGLWQGMLVSDVRHKQPRVYRQWQDQPETVCPPEGEMLGEADERVQTALMKILRRHRDESIGVVLPEPLLSLARRFLTQGELDDLWEPAKGRGPFEAIEVDPESLLAAARG
jgi:probable phosphoglycerate mutase